MANIKISLAAARVNAGLTQAEVKDVMGITNNTLIAWEKGEAEPRVSQAYRLADLYGLPIDAINFLPKKSN